MSILTTAPTHTKIDVQVPLADHIDDKHKKVSQSKSAPNSPVRRVVPLTLETAVELKYDLQETVIPYPQVEDSCRMIREESPSPLVCNIRDEIAASKSKRRTANVQR